MPKLAKELGALDIRRLTHPGGGDRPITVPVGGVSGLLLQVSRSGAKSWVLRTMIAGRRAERGLGAYPEVGLAQARERAAAAKAQIAAGEDPATAKRAAKAALAAQALRGLTFAEAVEKTLAAKLEGFKNAKHRQQWENTLATYATPLLGPMLVEEIAVADVQRVLMQAMPQEPEAVLWTARPETARRVRSRIEAVLANATAGGHRSGANPARWAGNLKELMPAANRASERGNHPAVQISDMPRFWTALSGMAGMGALAGRFAVLTATRSGEVRGARWSEIDRSRALWTVPAARMKMEKPHVVPLSDAALALLDALPRQQSEYIFPSSRNGQISDMTMSSAWKRLHEADVEAGGPGFADSISGKVATPHGTARSTFRDWAAERTDYPSDLVEFCLAHALASKVEAAYRRGTMIEKRRSLMTAWSQYIGGSDA